MRILLVHNRYRDRTGEDTVFDNEVNLLKNFGHTVDAFTLDNRDIQSHSNKQRLLLFLRTIWSQDSFLKMREKIRAFRPDIVHAHNFLPLLSPSIFYACKLEKVPVIQTLHNYRIMCPGNSLFLKDNVCNKCFESSLLQSVINRCYRHSLFQTATVAIMLQLHWWIGTWQRVIDGYIVLSDFQRSKMVDFGLPPEKIFVKPNFLDILKENNLSEISLGNYYLFAGRLIPEKGIKLLIEEYKLSGSSHPLLIAGSGKLADFVKQRSEENAKIVYLGKLEKHELYELMKDAIALLFPSIWYECSPTVILEAYKNNLPVIASEIGSLSEMVIPRKTGFVFNPYQSESLANIIKDIDANPQKLIDLKKGMSKRISALYHENENVIHLNAIYQTVIERVKC
jgi:glycosyltransferase involved in cell wall biosynthesis